MNPARLVQTIGWMAFLGVVLVSGAYAVYIDARQQWVPIAATAVFAALVLCDALFNRGHDHDGHDHHDHDHGTTADRWVQTVVHLIPLFLILTMGATTLGSQAITDLTRPLPGSAGRPASAQSTATPTTTSVVSASTTAVPSPATPATPTRLSESPSAAAAPPSVAPAASALIDGPTPADPTATPTIAAADPLDAPPATPLSLIDLYYPKKHPGVTRIETVGRLMIPTDEERAKAPPSFERDDLKILLYRYVMTCCAADAAPVFVVLKKQEVGALKIDQWAKITGTWIPAPQLGDMAKIVVDSLTVIDAPKEPFLQAPKE